MRMTFGVAGFCLAIGIFYGLILVQTLNSVGHLPLKPLAMSLVFMGFSAILFGRCKKVKKGVTTMAPETNAWTQEQLAQFECAVETIGNVIAIRAREIHEEKLKPIPDEARINALREDQAHLAMERHNLRLEDGEAIAQAIEHYGQIVRHSV